MKLEVELTDEQAKKLMSLAEQHSMTFRRKITPAEVFIIFLNMAQPGGSGWEHPTLAAKKAEKSG